MTTATMMTMTDSMEEGLAQLWLQLDHIGDSRFQDTIESVSDVFPVPEGSPSAQRTIQQGHDLFLRVHRAYSPRTQRKT